MKKFLKICDLYGTQFHLYYKYKPKFYSWYGGLFSIITVFAWIIVFSIFIINDLNKNESISTTSILPPQNYNNITFGNEKIYLPWRITDYHEKFIKHEGILFPKIYYISNKLNNETGLMEPYYHLINYRLCNETNMKNNQNDTIIDIPIDKLYCIDMDDLNIGGNWNSDYINYVRLDLYLCKDGIDYDKNNENCTSHEKLINIMDKNNNWFFELFYPVVHFQPTVKQLPILVYYKSFFYGLSLNTNRIDRVYFQKHIIEDQQNLIFNKPFNKSYWGISLRTGDNYFIDKRDPIRYGSTSRLYSLIIYLDYSTVHYFRKVKKLFEILGDAFPVVNIITTILGFISAIINELKANKKLNEFILFNHKDLIKRKTQTNENKDFSKSINALKFINNLKHIQKDTQDININNNKSKFYEDSSKLNCFHGNYNNNRIILNTKKDYISKKLYKKNMYNTVNFSKKETKYFEYFQKTKTFPTIFYFFGLCLNRINSRKNNNYTCISENFHKIFKFYTRLIDITSYISLHKQFEELKTTILNDINTKPINNFHKEISIHRNGEVTRKNKNKNSLIFRNMLKTQSLIIENKGSFLL
jgi:hypothetical protein